MAFASVKKKTILGQDPAILLALWSNVVSWFVRKYFPSYLPKLLPACEQEDAEVTAVTTSTTLSSSSSPSPTQTRCVSIGRPGGLEQLRVITLKPGIVTCGYNVEGQAGGPFTQPIMNNSNSNNDDLPGDCIVMMNETFSVNYADCCIRWGLYESAKQFVGYPIVPGFDVAGVVECVPFDAMGLCPFKVGQKVFGVSLFGAYSSRVLVPHLQLREIPKGISMTEAASLPTVSLTALYALFLAGHFPMKSLFHNQSILIHSAAGGVGSMLVQMSKVLGLSPIVGVVGTSAKVEAAKALGCDVVIDKSSYNNTHDFWQAVRDAAGSEKGYATIMDSNGAATLAESYDHLAMTGRLIVFGFHTNLPKGSDMLSPIEWLRMAGRMSSMPKFDPMEMGQSNKAVLAFNLSFFADEREMVIRLFDQIYAWLVAGKLRPPQVVEMNISDIAQAHELIQSGKTVGKIVINTA